MTSFVDHTRRNPRSRRTWLRSRTSWRISRTTEWCDLTASSNVTTTSLSEIGSGAGTNVSPWPGPQGDTPTNHDGCLFTAMTPPTRQTVPTRPPVYLDPGCCPTQGTRIGARIPFHARRARLSVHVRPVNRSGRELLCSSGDVRYLVVYRASERGPPQSVNATLRLLPGFAPLRRIGPRIGLEADRPWPRPARSSRHPE